MKLKESYNKIVKFRILILTIGLIFILFGKSSGQSIGYFSGTGCTFNTATEVAAGCTSTAYYTVQYTLAKATNYPAGWTLKVKANGNFTNGTTVIPAQYISLGFNSALSGPSGVTSTGYQPLSTTTPAALLNTSASLKTPPTYFEHTLNMRVQGGNHLTVGTGTYTTTLTLTLVALNGTVIATNSNVQASIVVNYSNTCLGASLASYSSNQHTFGSYTEQMAGATVTDAVSVQYNPNQANCTGWSLKVRAAGNFTNGGNLVAPQNISLKFNRVSTGSPSAAAMGVSTNPVPLNFSDVTLINQSNASFTSYLFTEHKFDMIIAGGNHLLVPNGTYTGSLIFTLYNINNEVVSTSTVSVAFLINSSTNSYTLVLQNTANEVDLVFNTVANYTNGVSVSKLRGLKVTGYNPYQVLLKTSGLNLEGSQTGTIPVGAVNVEVAKYTATSAGIVTYTRALSTADQIIITNPLYDYSHQVVEYDLRYYTAGNDSRLFDKAGIFSTSVLFVVIPQ